MLLVLSPEELKPNKLSPFHCQLPEIELPPDMDTFTYEPKPRWAPPDALTEPPLIVRLEIVLLQPKPVPSPLVRERRAGIHRDRSIDQTRATERAAQFERALVDRGASAIGADRREG